MLINKKQFTLKQLDILIPLIKFKSDLCSTEIVQDKQIRYKDIDPTSSFYFHISLTDFINQKPDILVEYMPNSALVMPGTAMRLKEENIMGRLENWLKLLETYNSKNIDDSIIDDYTEEYYTEFILINDPTNEKPLKIPQALLLDEYLKNLHNTLTDYSDTLNQEDIDEIKEDISELRNSITKIKKSDFVLKLSRISAKLTRAGLDLVKEFLSEAKKEGLKKVLGWAIENGPGIMEGLIKQITSHH